MKQKFFFDHEPDGSDEAKIWNNRVILKIDLDQGFEYRGDFLSQKLFGIIRSWIIRIVAKSYFPIEPKKTYRIFTTPDEKKKNVKICLLSKLDS